MRSRGRRSGSPAFRRAGFAEGMRAAARPGCVAPAVTAGPGAQVSAGGQEHLEAAAAGDVADRGAAAVGLDDAAHDGQAQTRAGRGRTGVGAAPAGVEDAGQVLLGDAAAAVGHRDHHPLPGALGGDRDRAVGGGAADRVDEEVAEDPAHFLAVHLDRYGRHRLADQPYAVLAGQRVRAREGVADQVVEGDPGRSEGKCAGVYAGEFEEVADHVVEAFHLGADLTQIAVGVGGDAVLQCLGHGAQAGQGGAQVVRDPGDQFPPGRLQGAFPGA